ncbi:MAG TPA: glycerol-3-phosphate acyltransferase [Dehalococcoidia bacterium]|nr:glycerol-3-phosphate acyltransferase [Dehalococcoidia bacterium]
MSVTVVLAAAYLLGSLPTSYIVVYRYTGRDIRTMGSGNPGTLNVLDTVGYRAAVIVGLIDVFKGMAAVSIAYAAGASDTVAILAAIVAVIGHDYSVFLRLDGGNGTATAVGGMLGLLPIPTFIAISFTATLVPIVRSRRRAGVIGLLSVPLIAYWFDAPDIRVVGIVVLISLLVVKVIRFEGFSPARIRPDR